jgi:DNA polymerase III subunit delta'
MDRLIGHSDAVALLRTSLAADRVSHAYLITGPRGVGRRTLALELAKALNCLADLPVRPCGDCRQCRLIQRGVHAEVRVVKRAPERRAILLRPPPGSSSPPRDYADNVEFIQTDAQMRPVDGRKKVYLILNAEELGRDAANRLLKTIEEPTHFVHFILTASDRGAVLPTIVSRCQEIRLRPVPRAELARALTASGLVDESRAELLAALSGGRPGWALAAIGDPSVFEVHQADVRELRDALAASRLDRLILARSLAERWSNRPDTVRATLRAWLSWWRDVLLVQVGLADRTSHAGPDHQAAIRTVAAQVSPSDAQAAQARVQQTLSDLEANVNARLTLDLLLLRLPYVRPATG